MVNKTLRYSKELYKSFDITFNSVILSIDCQKYWLLIKVIWLSTKDININNQSRRNSEIKREFSDSIDPEKQKYENIQNII